MLENFEELDHSAQSEGIRIKQQHMQKNVILKDFEIEGLAADFARIHFQEYPQFPEVPDILERLSRYKQIFQEAYRKS